MIINNEEVSISSEEIDKALREAEEDANKTSKRYSKEEIIESINNIINKN